MGCLLGSMNVSLEGSNEGLDVGFDFDLLTIGNETLEELGEIDGVMFVYIFEIMKK